MKSNKIIYLLCSVLVVCIAIYIKFVYLNKKIANEHIPLTVSENNQLIPKKNADNRMIKESDDSILKKALMENPDSIREIVLTGYDVFSINDESGNKMIMNQYGDMEPVDSVFKGVSAYNLREFVGEMPSQEKKLQEIKIMSVSFQNSASGIYTLKITAFKDNDTSIENYFDINQQLNDRKTTTLSLKKGETKTIAIDASTVPLRLTVN